MGLKKPPWKHSHGPSPDMSHHSERNDVSHVLHHLSGGEFADGTGLSMLPWRKERRTGSEISLRPQRVNPLHFAKNPGQEIARDASIRSKSHDANNAVIRSRSGETRREDATLHKTLL